MNECLDWINERINHSMISDDEKLNFQAFRNVLQSTDVFENHSGRFLLVRKGKVWGETFSSPQDTFSDDFDKDCIVFRIPVEGVHYGATISSVKSDFDKAE